MVETSLAEINELVPFAPQRSIYEVLFRSSYLRYVDFNLLHQSNKKNRNRIGSQRENSGDLWHAHINQSG